VTDAILVETDSLIVNGRVQVTTIDHANQTILTISPAGRKHIQAYDALGQIVRDSTDGFAALVAQYDAQGRVKSLSAGGTQWALGYDTKGRLTDVTNPLGQTERYAFDASDQVIRRYKPSGDSTVIERDAAGTATALTPPSRPAHRFTYGSTNLLEEYIAPSVGDGAPPVRLSYDADGRLARIIRHAQDTIAIQYDSLGRQVSLRTAQGSQSFAYDASTGVLRDLTQSNGENVRYTYDGALRTSATWSGAIRGSTSRSFNADFRIANSSINSGNTIAYGYDADGNLTSAGSLSVSRDPVTGLPIGSALGAVFTEQRFDAYGRIVSLALKSGGNTIFSATYTRDSLDRITGVTEADTGNTNSQTFAYDAAGKLRTVSLNGAIVQSYEYDANGNIVRSISNAGAQTATADAQDRLTQFGADEYTHSADGERVRKVSGSDTTRYTFSSLGYLLGVQLPGGTLVDYVVDAEGRRIGKKVNGVLTKGWLYDDQVTPVAELDGQNQLVSQFVYGERADVPEYMVKAGQLYRILVDGRGSVRLVVNATTGGVVQRLDYDAFGRITQNSNPGFQPFGFAAGLLDDQTGLTHFGAREYDATTARWLSKDPLLFQGGDENLYAYSRNDPVNRADRSGLESLSETEVAMAGMVAIGITMAHEMAQDLGLFHYEGPLIDNVPAGRAKAALQRITNMLGAQYGCWKCGCKNPGTESGNWVLDHIPAQSRARLMGILLFRGAPSCLPCSQQEGGEQNARMNNIKNGNCTPFDDLDDHFGGPTLADTDEPPTDSTATMIAQAQLWLERVRTIIKDKES
jgi:RHS repeat-associated protein